MNEMDEFLREKEEQFHVPFKEEYWDKASAFLQQERGATTAGFLNLKNIFILSGIFILSTKKTYGRYCC